MWAMCAMLPEGTNLRLLLVHCRCEPAGLTAYASVLEQVVQAVKSSEMTPLTSAGHDFTGAGYSLCVLLAESHLVVHTYPECSQSVIVELSVCDHMRSNEGRARQLARAMVQIFNPVHYIKEQCQMRPRGTFRAGQGQQVALDVEQLLAQREHQLSVLTPRLGQTWIDGEQLVACDLDEPWVTEPLVHVPLLLHPEPKKVVFIPGGAHPRGDLEILRHPTVEQLTILEEEHGEPFASGERKRDPRRDLRWERRLGNPRDFEPPAPVDLVILDLAMARDLSLLARARSWLGPEGLWGVRLPTRDAAPGDRGRLGLTAEEPPVFFWQHLPSAGLSLFAVSELPTARVPETSEWARRVEQRGLTGLQVVTPETLGAMFALPPLLGPLIAPFMVSFTHG